jgi:hypothetical protein
MPSTKYKKPRSRWCPGQAVHPNWKSRTSSESPGLLSVAAIGLLLRRHRRSTATNSQLCGSDWMSFGNSLWIVLLSVKVMGTGTYRQTSTYLGQGQRLRKPLNRDDLHNESTLIQSRLRRLSHRRPSKIIICSFGDNGVRLIERLDEQRGRAVDRVRRATKLGECLQHRRPTVTPKRTRDGLESSNPPVKVMGL